MSTKRRNARSPRQPHQDPPVCEPSPIDAAVELRLQLAGLLWLHGPNFWTALFGLISSVGHCECGRQPAEILNIGSTNFAVCHFCRTCWICAADIVPDESLDLWEENRQLLATYTVIVPVIPAVLHGAGSLVTPGVMKEWFALHALDRLKLDTAFRDRVVTAVVEEAGHAG
jgi:hypothetical protein